MESFRERVGQVLTDYRDGLLDGLEDAVDAIESIARATDSGRIEVTTKNDAAPQFVEVGERKRPPNLGHSISTNPPR